MRTTCSQQLCQAPIKRSWREAGGTTSLRPSAAARLPVSVARLLATGLPLRWLSLLGVPPPNATVHAGGAARGEFYTFQLGVYAPLAPLRILPHWEAHGPLRGPRGAALAPWRLRCINTPNGSAQAAGGITLGQGGVQPLWFGLDVPADAPPGPYRGAVSVEELEGGQREEARRAAPPDLSPASASALHLPRVCAASAPRLRRVCPASPLPLDCTSTASALHLHRAPPAIGRRYASS